MARRNNTRVRRKVNKNVKVTVYVIISLILLLAIFSVIFSLMNIGNNKTNIGTLIANIDISNMSQEEAKEKIEKWYEEIYTKEISIQYNEMEEIITLEQLGAKIDISEKITEVYKIGKSGNIIKDNYDILFTMLFGRNIELNLEFEEDKLAKTIDELNSKLPNTLVKSNYYIEENNLIIIKGSRGIIIDNEKFENELKNIILSENNKINVPVKEVSPQEINMKQIHEEIYKEVKDAYITENPVNVYPHVNGVDFAISIEEAEEKLLKDDNEIVIPLKITIPEITLEKLGEEAFPNKLASFTTRYNPQNENRTTNLKLASDKIDGTIILPGETFSYNKVVGERTIAKGYKEAAVYYNGKVVDGIGGGICQISSTLYNTVIYANLEITSRSNHRFLTSYVTAGRDATVSWGTIDFCFKNTRSYPIKISSVVKNGIVTIEIHGLNEEEEYEVDIETVITELIPYTTNYIKDSSLQEGEEQVVQEGMNGTKSVAYKVVKYNGIVISRELLSNDTYSALEKVIKQGTKKTNSKENETANGFEINKEQMNELNQNLLSEINKVE